MGKMAQIRADRDQAEEEMSQDKVLLGEVATYKPGNQELISGKS